MTISSLYKRLFVKIKGIKPTYYTNAEKDELREKMIHENREQNRNVFSCDSKLTQGLSIEKIEHGHDGGWLITKEGNPKDKIIYYIHGGGFSSGCTKGAMDYLPYFVNNFGYNIYSVDYRLAPEFMQPCALYDCLEGYTWLLGKFDPDNIVVMGESAGGNLSLCLAILLRDRGLPLPKAVYANSAPTQFVYYADSYHRYSLKEDFIVPLGIIDNIRDMYFLKEDEKDPYVSPLYADLKGLPPIYLAAGEYESLADDSKMFYEKLIEAGNDAKLSLYPNLDHAFIVTPYVKRVVKKAYPDLHAYLKTNLG